MMATENTKLKLTPIIRKNRRSFRSFHTRYWRIMRVVSKVLFLVSAISMVVVVIGSAGNYFTVGAAAFYNFTVSVLLAGLLFYVFHNRHFSHWASLKLLDPPNKSLIKTFDDQ